MVSRRLLMTMVLLLLLLVLIGAAVTMVVNIQSSGDTLRDTVLTRAAGAGQTAQVEAARTQRANR